MKNIELLGGGMSGVMVAGILKMLFCIEFRVITTGKVYRAYGKKAESIFAKLA